MRYFSLLLILIGCKFSLAQDSNSKTQTMSIIANSTSTIITYSDQNSKVTTVSSFTSHPIPNLSGDFNNQEKIKNEVIDINSEFKKPENK
jgi:hypothetical protein